MPQWWQPYAIPEHLFFMKAHVYIYMHAHTCCHICGTPSHQLMPPTSTPFPPFRPKWLLNHYKCKKTWINQDNSILFLDLWPLNLPVLTYTKFDVQVGVSHPKWFFYVLGPKKVYNNLLPYMLQCVLWKSSMTLYPYCWPFMVLNTHFIHHPSNDENYWIDHKASQGKFFSKLKRFLIVVT